MKIQLIHILSAYYTKGQFKLAKNAGKNHILLIANFSVHPNTKDVVYINFLKLNRVQIDGYFY